MRSIRCADTAAVCIQQIKRGSSNFNIHDQRFSKREIKLSCKSVVQTGFSICRRNKGKWEIFCKYWDYECLDSLISFGTRKEIGESSSLAFIFRFFPIWFANSKNPFREKSVLSLSGAHYGFLSSCNSKQCCRKCAVWMLFTHVCFKLDILSHLSYFLVKKGKSNILKSSL